jgi:hypothetical protein
MDSGPWVEIRGNNYQVTGNSGVNSPGDGYTTHRVSTWGCGNVFRSNHADLHSGGYGILIDTQSGCPATVYASNTAVHAGQGLTNVAVTR